MNKQSVDTAIRAAHIVKEINEALNKIAEDNAYSPIFSYYGNIQNDRVVSLCLDYREEKISSKFFLDNLIAELIEMSAIKESYKG